MYSHFLSFIYNKISNILCIVFQHFEVLLFYLIHWLRIEKGCRYSIVTTNLPSIIDDCNTTHID